MIELQLVETISDETVRQCLNRRIPSVETMTGKIRAWEKERNKQKARVNWRFSNQDARVKLERLYPEVNLS